MSLRSNKMKMKLPWPMTILSYPCRVHPIPQGLHMLRIFTISLHAWDDFHVFFHATNFYVTPPKIPCVFPCIWNVLYWHQLTLLCSGFLYNWLLSLDSVYCWQSRACQEYGEGELRFASKKNMSETKWEPFLEIWPKIPPQIPTHNTLSNKRFHENKFHEFK